jgi:hypothetical protein
MVTQKEVERAIEQIDFVIMDFTETIDSLKNVKEVLKRIVVEKKAPPYNPNIKRGFKNGKRYH